MPQTAPLTESQWLALANPHLQMWSLPLPVSPRKVRLFGCLCLQRCREWLSPEGRDAAGRGGTVRARAGNRRRTSGRISTARRGVWGYVGPHPVRRPWCTASLPNDFAAQAVALVIAEPGETLLNIQNGFPAFEFHEDAKQPRRVGLSCDIARLLARDAAQARADATRSAVGRTWNRMVRAVSERLGSPGRSAVSPAIQQQETEFQAALLRDIFGNPFRPVVFSPDWRTDTVLILARQMDESGEFSALPILADALQDAGCDNDELLRHCRETTRTHVRGCWAIDLVLERE